MRRLLAAAAVALLAASPALALGPFDMNAGAHVGYLKADDADGGDILLGLHVEARYRFVGIRAEGGYTGERRFAVQVDGTDASLTTRAVPFQFTANVYLPDLGEFEPYLAGGFGLYRQTFTFSDGTGIEESTFVDPSWHVGAGFRIPVGAGWSTYGEYKRVFLDPEYCNTLSDRLGEVSFDSNYLAAGLSKHF